MANVDDKKALTELDKSDVLGSIGLFPDQLVEGWTGAKAVEFPKEYSKVRNIVICGMGGSRFTPRAIKDLFADRIRIPIEIVGDYSLPGYAGKDTLVVLSSYSGTTEETIACAEQALSRGCKLAGIAKGGRIAELAEKHGFPFYRFDGAKNPCGQPRIGGGYLLMAHLRFLTSLGFLDVTDDEVKSAIEFARIFGKQLAADVPLSKNYAKQLALALKDKHPFIVGAEFLTGFTNGFANQINETAKMISDYRAIPELNHHMLEGLTHPESLHGNGIFVFIFSPLYDDRVQKRFAITKDVVEKQNVQTVVVTFTGPNKLSQMLEGFVLSGYVTFYLGAMYDVDPVAIPWVDYFKAQLAMK